MSIGKFGAFEASGDFTVIQAGDGAPVTVPDGALLFGADFNRDGPDLVLVNDGAKDIRIVDYFRAEAADIVTPEGAVLRADLV